MRIYPRNLAIATQIVTFRGPARVVELVRHGRLKSDCLYGVRVRVPPRVHPHVWPLLGTLSTVWIPARFRAILPQSSATYALLRCPRGVETESLPSRMEVSALKYSGGVGLHGRSALLRLQSDERLISLLRRGNTTAFEVLVARYESRLMAFCRHLLGSREDAEDVLQEVMTAAFNAILADDRPINVRPWLYRIARNRSLNHLRRTQAIAVDTMDYQLSEHGATTADKVHEREEFRLLVGDIHELPETQKTALVLREMDALSYEQIAEAMETTAPSVKSLLVRARVSLAEPAEARLLSCDQVRIELAEIAEGLQKKPSPLVRRPLRSGKGSRDFRHGSQ